MTSSPTDIARRRVLARLGLERLVSSEYLDIAAGHRAHADMQRSPATYDIYNLAIESPAGVYHPTPNSSSLFFLHNIEALGPPPRFSMLEIGTGSGAIALGAAKLWNAEVVATDISETTLDSARANARRNGLSLRFVLSDLFEQVSDGNFDYVVFNTPLIDKEPEDDLERQSLCDPGGRLMRGFVDGLPKVLKSNGVGLFGICCNSAYQQLEDVALDLRIVGLELVADGFWRAIVAARHSRLTPRV